MAFTNASWRFILVRSFDLLPLGELTNARGRTISLKLNDPGSASFNIPMDDDLGSLILPYTHGLLAYRRGSTGVKLVWSGYVNTIDEDITNNRMTVNVTGWLDRFGKRFVHKDYIFQAKDDAEIITNLFYDASLPGLTFAGEAPGLEFASGTNQATHFDGLIIKWALGSKPNTSSWLKWGGTLPNEGVGGATAYVPVTDPSMGSAGRSASYLKYQTNVLQAMHDLMNTENGCDISVDPLTRAFYVYRKRMRIRDDIAFGHGWGPQNIAQIGRQLDGSTVVNLLLAFGGAGTQPGMARDDDSMLAFGLIEEAASLSDQVGEKADATLAKFAAAEVAIRSTPRQLFSFTPFNWSPNSAVPEPFVDYDIGDKVRLGIVAKPRFNSVMSARVFGMSFSIDEENNEKIGALQVTP